MYLRPNRTEGTPGSKKALVATNEVVTANPSTNHEMIASNFPS